MKPVKFYTQHDIPTKNRLSSISTYSVNGGINDRVNEFQFGKTAHYMLRGVRSNGDKGPWSETISTTIGA